jgi:tetratricopeptide (TPR) repeat protein
LPDSLEKDLNDCEKIIYQGKYNEALKGIEEILEIKNISTENRIKALNLRSLVEFYLGTFVYDKDRFTTALNIAKEAHEESKKIDNPALLFQTTLFLRWSYYRLAMIKEIYEVEPTLDTIYKEVCLKNPEEAKRLEALYLIYRALNPSIRAFLGEPVPENYLEESLELTKKALIIADEQNELFPKHGAINNLIVYYVRTGRMKEAHSFILKFLEFYEELDNKYGIARAYWMLGDYHYNRGEYEEFLDYSTRKLRIWEEVDNKLGITNHNAELGNYYFSQGNYDKALEYFKKVLDYYTEKKDSVSIDVCIRIKFEGWWTILPGLAGVYLLIGDLDKALQYEEESLNLHKQTEYTLETAFSLSRLSKIYWQKGLQDKAVETAQESLKFIEKTENYLWIGNVLADLVFFSAETSDIDSVNRYLERLEEVNSKIKDRVLTQKINFSEAIILSRRVEERDRMRASLLFENLLREELEYAFHVQVLLSLSELLIEDLKETGDTKVLTKLQKSILDLYSLSTKNNSYILTVETLLLQSKLALVESDIDKAQQLLEQASDIAEDKKLERLRTEIAQEKENFTRDKDNLKDLDKDESLNKRIELINLDKRINGIKKTSISLKQSGEHLMLKSTF